MAASTSESVKGEKQKEKESDREEYDGVLLYNADNPTDKKNLFFDERYDHYNKKGSPPIDLSKRLGDERRLRECEVEYNGVKSRLRIFAKIPKGINAQVVAEAKLELFKAFWYDQVNEN
jgi:hypothetical protein